MYEKIKNFSGYHYVAFLAALVFSFMLGRASVLYNSTGTNNIGEQISSSEKQQHVITGQVTEAKQSVSDIRSIVADTGNAIADIEQILQGIRARGKKEIAKD